MRLRWLRPTHGLGPAHSVGLGLAASVAWLALGCASAGSAPPSPVPNGPMDTRARIEDALSEDLAAEGGAPAAATSAPASAPAPDTAHDDEALVASISEGPSDPLEPVNRSFFFLNRGIDYVLLDPLTKVYALLVPDAARVAVRRVFDNLNSAQILVNDLLQFQFEDAGVTAARFAINTTLGLGGILDPAERLGLQRHESDFGETLARIGIGPGFYLMLPLLGPSTVRDSIGEGVDGLMLPQAWVLGFGSRLLLDGGDGLSLREMHQKELDALRDSSVDYYAALRSAYWFDREGALRARLERSRQGSWSFHIVEPKPQQTAVERHRGAGGEYPTAADMASPVPLSPSASAAPPAAGVALEALRVAPAASLGPGREGPRAAPAP